MFETYLVDFLNIIQKQDQKHTITIVRKFTFDHFQMRYPVVGK